MTTSQPTRSRLPRGVSLIEMMVASAVLIIGLTGITAMMIRGAVNGRNGQQAMTAANLVNQKMSELQAANFDALVVTSGSFDAGTARDAGYVVDGSGRKYQSAYVVKDISTTWPMYLVQVQLDYTDGNGKRVIDMSSAVISRAPDAG